MSKTFNKIFFVPLTIVLIFVMLFSFAGCNEEKKEPMTADVRISVIDKNDTPIVNTDIWVLGISDMEIVSVYKTDSNGQFTIRNLGERNITVIIHSEEESFSTSYAIAKSDLEQGEITIKFNEYEK